MKNIITIAANRAARQYGTNRASDVIENPNLDVPARVKEFDGYHWISRTGIRAGAAAGKKWPKTYTYVATYCLVEVNSRLIRLQENGSL